MNHLLITQLWVEGMRSLDRVELEISAPVGQAERDHATPTVLIGPNGAGKSTLVEACELLRKAGTERSFVASLFDTHGGPPALVRRNANRLVLGTRLASRDGAELSYDVSLRSIGMTLTIESERATIREPGRAARSILERRGRSYSLAHGPSGAEHGDSIDEVDLALPVAAFHDSNLKGIQAALASIEIHTAIDARAAWTTSAGTSSAGDPGVRASNIVRPATRVELGGRNLPNVYYALRQQKDWPQTLERIRLALGDQVEDVVTPADPSGGRIGLALRIFGLGEVPAFSMSDGQLSYLALIGVLRLQRPTPPALIAIDEPELHLHPSLARRLMADLETFSRSTSLVVATQSDAMLDTLSDPVRASVLCELDEHHATRLIRPEQESLRKWIEDYRGLGELRAAGYERVVFPALETP